MAEQWAKFMGDPWRFHGVHKWIAYDRVSDEVVGRGGLSCTPFDDGILKLRSLLANGDLDAYWHYHLRQEHKRIHGAVYREDLILAA